MSRRKKISNHTSGKEYHHSDNQLAVPDSGSKKDAEHRTAVFYRGQQNPPVW